MYAKVIVDLRIKNVTLQLLPSKISASRDEVVVDFNNQNGWHVIEIITSFKATKMHLLDKKPI